MIPFGHDRGGPQFGQPAGCAGAHPADTSEWFVRDSSLEDAGFSRSAGDAVRASPSNFQACSQLFRWRLISLGTSWSSGAAYQFAQRFKVPDDERAAPGIENPGGAPEGELFIDRFPAGADHLS